MKRKTAWVLAWALALLLTLQCAPLRGEAASTVYFTAANDTLLDLSDATMPFWSDGILYVPASIFGGGGLSVSYSYNSGRQTVVLSRGNVKLICNMSAQVLVDNQGNAYEYNPIDHSGVVFLPINLVCRVLSLTCTTRTITYGYLVRIRDDGAVYSDESFVSAAASMMSSRYADYEAAHGSPADPGEEPQEPVGETLYLGLRVESAGEATAWLDALKGTSHRVTFFLTEEFLRQAPSGDGADVLRRMAAEGHGLGLQIDAVGGAAALEAIRRGNETLERLLCANTRLVLLSGAAAQRSAVERAGYCPVEFDLDYAADGFTAAKAAGLLSAAGSTARVNLGGEVEAEALTSLLSRAASRGYQGQAFRETAYRT